MIYHFADNIFKCIFLKENACISLQIALKIVPRVSINSLRLSDANMRQ